MANPLSSIAIQQFRDSFTNEYARGSVLDGSTMMVHGVVGDAYKWPILGNSVMELRGSYKSIVPNSELDHSQVTTTFDEYVLKLSVDRGEQTLVNAQERAQHARKHAEAAGRQKDQWVIDAINGSGTSNTVAEGTTNISLDKILEGIELLDSANVPGVRRHIALSPNQYRALLKLNQFTSIDYNSVRALMTGEINQFLGLTWHKVPDFVAPNAVTFGLPKTGDERTVLMWQEEAVGVAMKMDATVDAMWDTASLTNISVSQMIGGSSAVLPNGMVLIGCDETK